MIGRYGGCFEEGRRVYAPAKLRGTRDASNGGKVRVRIIRGLNISHNTTKKYTSVMIRVCHSRSRFLSCMYINDDFMTESR